MKKILIFFGCVYFIHAQTSYFGSISFDYSGTENGSFHAEISDSSLGGATAGVVQFDSSSSMLISAIEAIDTATVSLLLIYLTAEQGDINPNTWSLPPDDLIDPDVVFAYFPEVDTSFFSMFEDMIPDSGDIDSTLFDEILEDLFTIITEEAFVGLTGSITLNYIDPDSLVGSFDVGALQAGFPPGAIDISNGVISMTGVSLPQVEINDEVHIPSQIDLFPAYPNPFNPVTKIRFSIGNTELHSLQIYDITGRLVETLMDELLDAGEYEIMWNASTQPSGIYFVQLVSGSNIQTEKVILLK